MSHAVAVRAVNVRELARSARFPVLDTLSVAMAAAPFVVVGLLYAVTGHLVLGGDQSLIALDAFDVRHFDQAVGPYSRMGWAHPGPAWTYLLAPLYWLFGSSGAALIAASMLVHALAAALVVVAAGTGRPWQRPVMAAVLLLYVLRMPAIDFVSVWNPFALLLPTVLLLLLAARACVGSVPAFAASLIVLSFLVQTHVGTVPLVALVGGATAVILGIRLVRSPELRPGRAAWVRTGIAGGVAVLMWVPPLWQQLTAAPGQGNLAMIARYFLHGGSAGEATHTWGDAVSGVGQMLGAPVYGWPAQPALLRIFATPAVLAAVAAQLLGSVLVAVLARRLADRQTSWLAALTAVATVAALISTRTVTGPLMNYLILWVTVLPAVLLFAAVSFVVVAWRPLTDRLTARPLAVVVLGVAVLGAGVGLSFERSSETQLPSQPGAHEAAALALHALPAPGRGGSPVLLDIRDISVWTTATEVALELEQAGYRITVQQQWTYGFGHDRLATGSERWRLSMAPVVPGQPAPAGELGVVDAINGPEAILLQRAGR